MLRCLPWLPSVFSHEIMHQVYINSFLDCYHPRLAKFISLFASSSFLDQISPPWFAQWSTSYCCLFSSPQLPSPTWSSAQHQRNVNRPPMNAASTRYSKPKGNNISASRQTRIAYQSRRMPISSVAISARWHRRIVWNGILLSVRLPRIALDFTGSDIRNSQPELLQLWHRAVSSRLGDIQ